MTSWSHVSRLLGRDPNFSCPHHPFRVALEHPIRQMLFPFLPLPLTGIETFSSTSLLRPLFPFLVARPMVMELRNHSSLLRALFFPSFLSFYPLSSALTGTEILFLSFSPSCYPSLLGSLNVIETYSVRPSHLVSCHSPHLFFCSFFRWILMVNDFFHLGNGGQRIAF